MLVKQLQYLAGADAAGIVCGTRVPIVLTSRADNVRARLASTAVLKLVAHDPRAMRLPEDCAARRRQRAASCCCGERHPVARADRERRRR